MTIGTTGIKVVYIGDAVNEDFNFNFKTFNESSIKVFEDGIPSAGMLTVSLNSDQDASPGGGVNVSPAPALNVRVTVTREEPLTQNKNYIVGGKFPAESHEQGLDILTQISQQQQDELNRKVGVGINDDGTTDYTLPSYSASKGFKYDPTLKKIILTSNDPDSGPNADISAAAALVSENSAAASETQAGLYAADAGAAAGIIINYPITGGSSGNYTATLGINSYVTNTVYKVIVHEVNAAGVSINFDGIGAKSVKTPEGYNFTGGELQPNSVIDFLYNGTFFVALNLDKVYFGSVMSNNSALTGIGTTPKKYIADWNKLGNRNNEYDFFTNDRFEPSKPGYYKIVADFFWNVVTVGDVLQVILYKNGSGIETYTFKAAAVSVRTSASFAFNTTNGTDYYEIFVANAGGNSTIIIGPSCNLKIDWLGN